MPGNPFSSRSWGKPRHSPQRGEPAQEVAPLGEAPLPLGEDRAASPFIETLREHHRTGSPMPHAQCPMPNALFFKE
ncbi:MAG: hypothetical protein ICV85_15550 [Tolypothrix sp. T3-bin4]|nr:hypothetical protein [Tolypothrix sp. T3-bin4]